MYGIIPKQSKQTAATHWVCWQINFTYRTPTHPLARGPGLSFRMEMEKRAVLEMECRLPSANLRKTINFRPASNIKGENLFESFQRFLPPKTHTQTPTQTQTREAAAGSGPINAVKCKSFCIFSDERAVFVQSSWHPSWLGCIQNQGKVDDDGIHWSPRKCYKVFSIQFISPFPVNYEEFFSKTSGQNRT